MDMDMHWSLRLFNCIKVEFPACKGKFTAQQEKTLLTKSIDKICTYQKVTYFKKYQI